jgi:hypothetical protein
MLEIFMAKDSMPVSPRPESFRANKKTDKAADIAPEYDNGRLLRRLVLKTTRAYTRPSDGVPSD